MKIAMIIWLIMFGVFCGIIPFGNWGLFLGVGLIIAGITTLGESRAMSIVELTLGVLAIILGIGFVFYPSLFSVVAAIFVFIAGLFLIISGIVALATRVGGNIWTGLIAIVLGIIYLIVAIYVANPLYLGILIGLWLLITGILMLVQK